MSSIKRKWAFSLTWINLAVVIVVLIQVAGNQITQLPRTATSAGYALVFANLTGVLGVLVMSRLVERTALHIPLILVVPVGILVFCPLGCLLAQTLLMVIGVVVPRNFWKDYLNTLRVSLPLATCLVWALQSMDACANACSRWRRDFTRNRLRNSERRN